MKIILWVSLPNPIPILTPTESILSPVSAQTTSLPQSIDDSKIGGEEVLDSELQVYSRRKTLQMARDHPILEPHQFRASKDDFSHPSGNSEPVFYLQYLLI